MAHLYDCVANQFIDGISVFIVHDVDKFVQANDFIYSIWNYFGLTFSNESLESFESNADLNNFLDDASCYSLCVAIDERNNQKKIVLSNQAVNLEKKCNVLVFFKLKPMIITGDNMHDTVFISSMFDSPVSTLYHTIQKVFAPSVLKDDSWGKSFDPKLQQLMSQLEQNLKRVLLKQNPQSSQPEEMLNLPAIITIEDEVQFWSALARTSDIKEEQLKAQSFLKILKLVEKDMSSLESASLLDGERVLDDIQNALDDLWKLEDMYYPQQRMEHLMEIIGNEVTGCVQSKFKQRNLWNDSFMEIEELMNQAIGVCDKWVEACQNLTTLFWPNYKFHPWRGSCCIPVFLVKLKTRLQEILQVRTMHRQLVRLLSSSEQENLRTKDAFLPFSGMNPVQFNPYTDPLWQVAMKRFEDVLAPAEAKVASKLRTQLNNLAPSSPLQFLQEFKRYLGAVERPSIARALLPLRENLLVSLMDYVNSVEIELRKSETHHSSSAAPLSLPHMPRVVSSIYWARQLEAKVVDVDATSSKILSDLNGYRDLQVKVSEVLKDLREYSQNQFDEWVQDIMYEMQQKVLSLRTDEPVVTFEENHQFMHVKYNKRLVGLIREVRQLSLLGFRIPTEIKAMSEKAKKFSNQAKALEQVANFHNTIGDRMIPSQRPMMLKAALELSRLVQGEGNAVEKVTWSDTSAVNNYLSQLKSAVDRLSKENTRLAAYHLEIQEKAIMLMSTDLLHHQQKWKEAMSEVRSIMNQVENQGFTNMKSWRIHWDRQFYKVLEYQYQIGLEALNEHLPEMKVDLVFRQQKLQFQPPIEEIRTRYYGQIKRFISIPNTFRGAGGEEHLFPIMIERNAHCFGKVFEKAELLLSKLEKVKAKFAHWVALGTVDVDRLVRENLLTWQDWDMNFKASKAWEQQIAKLPCNEEKIECFCVNVLPVRADIEVHNRRFWDLLASSLQAAILHDVATVEQFASGAIEVLQHSSPSLKLEDVNTASAHHAQILKEAPGMHALLLETEKKNKTLASWTKERVDRVRHVSTMWDSVQSILDNYEVIISKQLDTIKACLHSQAENLAGEVKRFALRWEQVRPREESLVNLGGMDTSQKPLQNTLNLLREKRDEWNLLMLSVEKLNSDFVSMGMEAVDIPECSEVENDLQKFESMWSLFDEFNTGLQKLGEEEWIVFRSRCYKFEEFLLHWCEKLDLPEGGATSLTVRIYQEIESHKDIIPLLKYIRGETFSDSHWHELLKILGIPEKPADSITFGDFLNARLAIVEHIETLKELNARSASEIVIRQALNELDIWDVESKFTLTEHRDSQGRTVYIVTDYKDILNKVGDHQCLLQSVKNSANFEGFSDRVTIWESRLSDLDDYLHQLTIIQRKWLYLEPIFGSGVLASEGARFSRIDSDFRWVAKELAQEGFGGSRGTRVSTLCRIPGLRQVLTSLVDQLARCQRSLNEFLEEKRSCFPRFYFLGDEDLLEILGQSMKQKVIQAHLKKLFAGIHSVIFDESGQSIVAMKSQEGEIVQLKNHVKVSSQIEEWLGALLAEMKNTLKNMMKDSVLDCLDLQDNVLDPSRYPSQIHCMAEYIVFCGRCERSIMDGSLPSLLSSLKAKIDAYTKLNVSKKTHANDEKPGHISLYNIKIKALLLDIIHFLGIVEELIAAGTTLLSQWAWQKQLRFYSRKDGSVFAKMAEADFEYTFEYQGNASKLVQTPLTHKCFLTLTQAMQMGLGGNPYGPAGTGKTETVKALGSLFGRQVLVFNCDQGIDVKSMERIFVGLVKCGAWGCFDEFNRLKEATMSSVSSQIQLIQTALRSERASVRLMEQEVHLDHNCGIFVTLNPAGKGYGDRRQLPNNLKQLFRPVVMSQPDSNLIAEVVLQTEGFKNARVIGKKLVEVFNLASSVLSHQHHYDWGLRALKTVLHGCGSDLNSSGIDGRGRRDSREEDVISEENVSIRSLRLHTLSKLTSADCFRFDSIVADVFGTKDFEYQGSNNHQDVLISEAVRKCFAVLGLVENDRQVRKCLEVYEQLKQRMGVVIVGPPRSGKSTILHLLKSALVEMGQTVKVHTLSPKAMPKIHLLGNIDPDTREWSDGILTLTAQQIYAETPDVWSWLVLDGDVDPEWIESLNSVLDDNRLLTLPSGWRIRFGPNVNFLFETHDLSQASPATVSRMGVILLSDDDVNVKGIVKSWLNKNDNGHMRFLPRYIEDYFYKAIEWVMSTGEIAVGRSMQSVSLVMSGLSHLDSDMNSKAHFAIALVHGLGSNLSFSSREAFAKQVFEWAGENPSAPMDYSSLSLHCFYNSERDCIDLHHTERWEAGKRLQSPGNILSSASSTPSAFSAVLPLILTADVKGALDQVGPWLKSDRKNPFILVGPAGCGKSSLLRHCFSQLRSTEVAVIHCSAQITPQHVLQKLNHVCMAISNPSGRVYRPRDTENLILYFKDLHMVKPDKWGTSMLIAFLQQVISYSGFHDGNLEWIGLDKVQIVATMSLNSTEAQRIPLSPRFMSLVNIYSMRYPDKEQLSAIYNTCMSHVIGDWLPKHSNLKSSGKLSLMVECIIRVYLEVKNNFSAVDQSHYVFSPVDITRWCLALRRYQISEKDLSSSMDPILEVLIFEACRIFRDKLVSNDDRAKFDDIVIEIMKEDWNKPNLLDNLKGVFYITEGQSTKSFPRQSTRVTSVGLPLSKIHFNDWSEFVKKAISQYERESHSLDLLMIPELMEGVAKAERALTTHGGSLLLAGRSGFGRKSAVRLVSSRLGARLIFPGSGQRRFSKDLKQTMQLAGIDGEQVYILLEDHHLEDSLALDMINSLLSSGEVPGLYTVEEFESIISPLKELANNDDYPGSVPSYFTERVRSNLHAIIVMDITDPSFVTKLESNPALVRQCSMQWLDSWSDFSMASIPRMMCERSAEELENKLGELQEIVPWELFGAIHSSAPKGLTTPWRYLSLIKTFQHIFAFKKENISSRQERLKAGVAKLTEARAVVDGLKAKAAAQKTILSEKQEKASEALQAIAETMRGANVHKGEMEALQEKMIKENKVLVERKAAIDSELSEVEPLVREASKAVGEIKSEALSEIRSLRAPPDVVRDILEGVLRLMGIQDTSWNSMKIFLAKRGVKEEIRAFDAHVVLRDNREAVEELLKERAESFNPKVAKRASVAAAPLATWVRANVRFAHVLEKIRPLEKEQAVLSKNLKFAEHQLANLASGLADVEGNVQKLQAQLSTFSREAAETEVRLGDAQNTLKAAEGLVSQLEDEYQRWKLQVKELSQELNDLPMKALLASAFVTYLLPSSEDLRKNISSRWEQLPAVMFDLCSFLSSERELLQWQAEGLSTDSLSSENAVAILKIPMCPLLIDPGLLAQDWLTKHMQDKTVEVVSQELERFDTTLELAVRFGKVLIVEDVEYIHPLLIPILRRDFIYQGTRRVVPIEDKLVDFNENFRLFLITHNDSPKILPSVGAVITYVNFTTTEAGLSGQLLNGVLQHEKPELDARRVQLLKEEEQWNIKLERLQENLLQELTGAQGDILQNKELLHSLNETKTSSSAVTQSLSASSNLRAELKKEYDVYCPLADFGSALYFATVELRRINSIYQFSTSALMSLMNKALAENEDKEDLRTKDLQNKLIGHSYYYISRSLFKCDRLMFALHLAHKMFPYMFKDKEWEFFTSQTVADVKGEMAKVKLNLPEWVEEDRVYNLCQSKVLLPNLYAKLNLSKDSSKPKLNMEQNEKDDEMSKLTPFQKVLVAQTLIPDQLHTAMTHFSQHALGLNDLSPPPISLRRLLREALPTEPILFIVSPGTDPSEELRALAHDVVGDGHYHEVALGQQGSVGWTALAQQLREAHSMDEWVCLKNLHLATEFLPFLERELRSLYSSKKQTENFRVWLITEPHPEFSQTLARSSLKVTFESPPGVKKNMQRTLTTWGSNFLCPGRGSNGVLRARALFTLAWFHAVVQERRNFIPQGWYKHYEFGDSDLRAASFILDGIFSKDVEVGLESVHGLCGTAIYGGHIDNVYDLKVLLSYLHEYFEYNMLTGRGQKKLLGPTLDLPLKENYREFLDLVQKLPDSDNPSQFGLPKNVECSWQRIASQKIIEKLKGLIHSNKSEIDVDRDKLRAQMSPILTMWKKLIQSNMKIFSSKAVAKAESPEIVGDPIADFFHVEYAQGVTLVQEIHRCLTSISKVIRGFTSADSETLNIADSLMRQQIPSSWLAQWDGPKDPSLYLQGLLLRTAIAQKFFKDLNSSISGSIDLSNLLHPVGFLSALKQKSAREYGTTVDTLKLASTWGENVAGLTGSAKLPVKVTGIQIEGAVLNDQGLVPCGEDSPSVSVAPDCFIAWIPENLRSYSEESISLPIYQNERREIVVINVNVPCNSGDRPRWIQAGVALFLRS
ncbi:cytoplasmic dynein 2 heavy chain 1 [Hetaerina americana]|uniref:cytoplasmic dynein 2 heavy chain 1 n=1 Tax=Hetaerina americana TaxID=62018 RepID=UPI003A7F12A2